MTDQSVDAYDTPIKTPGQLLQAARKAKKLKLPQVAAKLYLSVQCIKDLEADDYKHLRAMIYVRGYIRSYARLLEIEAEPMLSAFDQLGYSEQFEEREIAESYASTGVQVQKKLELHKQNFLRWGSVAIVGLLVVLVVMWWYGQRHNPHAIVSTNLVANTTDQLETVKIPITVNTNPTSHE